MGVYEEPQSVDLYGSKKLKMDVIIADTTKSLILTLWENQISTIKTGECYTFKNVSTRRFDDNIKLTTTPKTTIIPIPQMQQITTELMHLKKPNQMTGKIISVSVQTAQKCISCHKRIEDQYIGNIVTKCPNCNMKQKNSSLSVSCQSRINLQDTDQTIHRFTAFETTISKFLEEVNKTQLAKMPEDLEDFLLMQEEIFIEHNNDIITKMTIQNK